MEPIKVLVCDDNRDFCNVLSSFIADQNDLSLVGVTHNGNDTLELIQQKSPDVVLLDLIMPRLDGIGVLEKIRELDSPRPQVIALTGFGQELIMHRAFQLGASYLIMKPVDLEVLSARIRSLNQLPVPVAQTSLRKNNQTDPAAEITNILHNLGIPAHIKGYQFLRDAVQMVINNQDLLGAVTKELYPSIGEKYSSSGPRVERAIRHAITVGWERGNQKYIQEVFGYRNDKIRPTNAEFIAVLADKLKMDNLRRPERHVM